MRKIIFSTVMAVMIGSAQIAGATPITLGFSPSTISSTGSGGSYSVDVILSNLPTNQVVSAFDLSILYNPAFVNATAPTFTSLLGVSGEMYSNFSFQSGVLNIRAVSQLSDSQLGALQGSGGSITLATLNFTGVTAGVSNLAFDWHAGKDIKGSNNQVIAGYVPEPATYLLFGSGLLSLLGFRRRSTVQAWFRRQGTSV